MFELLDIILVCIILVIIYNLVTKVYNNDNIDVIIDDDEDMSDDEQSIGLIEMKNFKDNPINKKEQVNHIEITKDNVKTEEDNNMVDFLNFHTKINMIEPNTTEVFTHEDLQDHKNVPIKDIYDKLTKPPKDDKKYTEGDIILDSNLGHTYDSQMFHYNDENKDEIMGHNPLNNNLRIFE